MLLLDEKEHGIMEKIMKLKYYLRGLGIGIVVTAIIMSITNKPQEMTDAQIKMRAAELGMVEESVLSDLQVKEESNGDETVDDILNQFNEEKEEQNQEVVSETEVEEENSEQTAGEAETENIEENQPAEDVENTEDDKAQVADEGIVEETASAENNTTEKEDTQSNISVSGGAEVVDAKEVEEIVGATEETEKQEEVQSSTIIKVERGNGSEVVSRRLYEAGLVESAVEYNQFLVKNGYDRRLSVGEHEIPAGATYEEMARILCRMN